MIYLFRQRTFSRSAPNIRILYQVHSQKSFKIQTAGKQICINTVKQCMNVFTVWSQVIICMDFSVINE